MVYACFVAKMSKMAFTRFGGQFQFEKSNGGQVRQFWGRDDNQANQKSDVNKLPVSTSKQVTFHSLAQLEKQTTTPAKCSLLHLT